MTCLPVKFDGDEGQKFGFLQIRDLSPVIWMPGWFHAEQALPPVRTFARLVSLRRTRTPVKRLNQKNETYPVGFAENLPPV